MQIHLTLVSCHVGRSCFDSGARPGEGGDKLDWLDARIARHNWTSA